MSSNVNNEALTESSDRVLPGRDWLALTKPGHALYEAAFEMIEEVRKAYAEYQSGKSGKGKKASEAADVLSFPTSGDDIE